MRAQAIPPLLTESEADVFRIAHSYRNRAYHRGELNAAALPTIARIFLVVLTRAWSRAQPSIGVDTPRWRRLRASRLARVGDDDGYVWIHEAAEQLADALIADGAVDPSEVRDALVGRPRAPRRRRPGAAGGPGPRRPRPCTGCREHGLGEMYEALERTPEMIADVRDRRKLARQLVAAGADLRRRGSRHHPQRG